MEKRVARGGVCIEMGAGTKGRGSLVTSFDGIELDERVLRLGVDGKHKVDGGGNGR